MQFSECYWCLENKRFEKKSFCQKKCSDFLDENLSDDLACFKEVFSELIDYSRPYLGIKGFTPWTAWVDYCECKAGKKLICPQNCNRETFDCNKTHSLCLKLKICKKYQPLNCVFITVFVNRMDKTEKCLVIFLLISCQFCTKKWKTTFDYPKGIH